MKEKLELIKKNKTFIVIVGVFVIMAIVLIALNGKTYATPEEDTISITCPETAGAGEEIECNINATFSDVISKGVQAVYSITEGLTYVSFMQGDDWTPQSKKDTGFILTNLDGVTGLSKIGSVKFKIPNDAESNKKYIITLTDLRFTKYYNDQNSTVKLEDASAEIRVLSSINTLDSLSLSNGTIKETFNKDVTNYTAETTSESVKINYTKTDENSTVEGDIDTLNLHYGTNNYSIKVISEVGTEKVYNISIFRPYEFTTENYKYSKEDNYIYTKADTDSATILSNISLPNELSAKVENNKLIISYGEEKLLDINIVNINYSKYTVVDNTIYVGKNIEYSDFINSITLNGVKAKVYDTNNTEINSGSIQKDYKLKILLNNTELAEYTFNEEYLNMDESLIVDDTNKIIKRQKDGTTVDELTSNISTSGKISVKDKDGKALSKTDKLKTGDVVEVKLSSGTYKYKISVLGDINKDGKISVGDVGLLYRNLKGKAELALEQAAAGDIINDGSIKISDVAKLYRFIKNKIDTLETIS